MMSQLGTGSEISIIVCDEWIILKSYETETMSLLQIIKEVRGKGTEETNTLKKKLGKILKVSICIENRTK